MIPRNFLNRWNQAEGPTFSLVTGLFCPHGPVAFGAPFEGPLSCHEPLGEQAGAISCEMASREDAQGKRLSRRSASRMREVLRIVDSSSAETLLSYLTKQLSLSRRHHGLRGWGDLKGQQARDRSCLQCARRGSQPAEGPPEGSGSRGCHRPSRQADPPHRAAPSSRACRHLFA